MVTIKYDAVFERNIKKIKDGLLKLKVKKQIEKIVKSPEIGKPMKFGRKGTREVYIPPFRLSYSYIKEEDTIIFFELYHKDEQ
ncbi:MAG: type II toxin-antitoxin system RelE/ParE family toxin [Nanoarchaeota archaeon]